MYTCTNEGQTSDDFIEVINSSHMVSSGLKDLRDVSVLGRASKKPLKTVITANLCVFILFYKKIDGVG